jgi:hypothetical protein
MVYFSYPNILESNIKSNQINHNQKQLLETNINHNQQHKNLYKIEGTRVHVYR